MNPQQQHHNQLQSPYNVVLMHRSGAEMSTSRQQQTPPLHLLQNQQQFQPPPSVQYRAYQLPNHQQMPSTMNFNFSRIQNIQLPPQTSSLISPPLEKGPFNGKSFIVSDFRAFNPCFTMASFIKDDRVSAETPAPMPLVCELGADTPSPSNHSSSPLLDSSEFLMMALQDDQNETTRKRKASDDLLEKSVRKRHRRTKAEISAARMEMLKKGLKPCSVNAEKLDVTGAETSVRVFQGQSTRMISKNLPRVPRMKFVPKQFTRIDELGFMRTKKGIIYSCMTACNFKTNDCATFSNHLIKWHAMGSSQSSGGKKCHSCGLYTPDGSLKNELKHIRDHVLDKNIRIQDILYSTVKNWRQEDSDEDSDSYEDEDEEAVAQAPSMCKSEPTVQEKVQATAQDSQGQKETTETAAVGEALDDGAEQPLDDETSKALEDALVECDMNGLFDDLQEALYPDDPDFDPEQDPQSEEEGISDENVTSEEENFYSCDNEDQDRLITTEVSRKSRKIRSDRKRAAWLRMQALVEKVHDKKGKNLSEISNLNLNGDKENEDPITDALKESEDEILRPANGSLKNRKTRIHSSDDASSSSRHSMTTSGPSSHTKEDSEDSKSSEDFSRRSSPVLRRRKTRSTSKGCASESTAKSSRGKILNFPATSDSRSGNEPATSTPNRVSKRRRKIISPPNSGSDTDIDDPNVVPAKNELQHEKSLSSVENEAMQPAKLEVETEKFADSSDEYSKADDDVNFLDKMPIAMVMKIRDSITTRNTNLPMSPPQIEMTTKETLELVVQETSTELPTSAVMEPSRQTSTTSTDSIAEPVAQPQPTPLEENNNDQTSGDRNKLGTKKVLTVAERYQQKECRIFKTDRRKMRSSQQPTARKSTSRSLNNSLPEVGTEAYENMLRIFRVRSVSVDVVRMSLDDVEKKNEPLKIKIANVSNCDLATEMPASASWTDCDENLIDIIRPVPASPYDSHKHSLKPAAETSSPKSTAQVEPPPPDFVICESLRELYPWVTEDIARRWKKSSSAIKSLMQKNSLFSTYKCMSIRCSFFTTDLEAFKAHLEQHRGIDKKFLCSFCLSDEQSPEELIGHCKLRHTKDRYQCKYCMYRSTEKFYCVMHQNKYHKNKSKSIYKSPVIILLKAQRSKVIKKQEQKLRNSPETTVKVLHCKFCDLKFFDMQRYCKHLKNDKNHKVKLKATFEEANRVNEMITRDVCEYGRYQCLYCDDGGFNKLELMKEHLVDSHPYRFALICKTGLDSSQLDRKRAGNSSNFEIMDAASHDLTIVDLVDPKQLKNVKVNVFKGNLEDLKFNYDSNVPPMLIANVESNVKM